MKWVDALKIYNEKTGMWCVPRRGTNEYNAVMNIMNEKPEALEAPKKKRVIVVKRNAQNDMMNEILSLQKEALKMVDDGASATKISNFFNNSIQPKLNLYGKEYLASGGASELADELFDVISDAYMKANIGKKRKVTIIRRIKPEEFVEKKLSIYEQVMAKKKLKK